VDSLKAAHQSLWEPYFDETVAKPYRQEVENAQVAAKSITPELTEFVKQHLTQDMLKPGFGDTILKLMSVDEIRVYSVETPLPRTEENLNRTVTILIKVSAECTVLISRDASYVMPFYGALYRRLYSADESNVPPIPEELEIQLTWDGGISATADIVEGYFKNIVPKTLVPVKEPGK
jgi:hypothetical protein